MYLESGSTNRHHSIGGVWTSEIIPGQWQDAKEAWKSLKEPGFNDECWNEDANQNVNTGPTYNHVVSYNRYVLTANTSVTFTVAHVDGKQYTTRWVGSFAEIFTSLSIHDNFKNYVIHTDELCTY